MPIGSRRPGVRNRGRRRLGRLAIAAAAVVAVGATGVQAAGAQPPPRPGRGDNVVLHWNQTGLDSIIKSTMAPPFVARALAVYHTCIYDAWAAYDAKAVGTRLGGQLRQPARQRTLANKNEAISYAAYTAGVDLWPALKSDFTKKLRSLGYSPAGAGRAGKIGIRACQAVLDFRHDDGSNQLGDLAGPGPYADYSGYKPANDPMDVTKPMDKTALKDPNRWQPLVWQGEDGQPITPTWLGPAFGNVTPFAMTGWDQFKLKPPATVNDPEYKRQAKELVDIAANLTDKQKAISEHWADEGPGFVGPPGTWSRIGQWVSRRDRNTVDEDAKMFFAVNNAVFDAAIAAWGYKRYYDSVRPVSAIRYLYSGQQIPAFKRAGSTGPTMIDGGMWMAYQPPKFVSPMFADFPSGHSSFGTAGAEILKRFTGSDRYGASEVVRKGTSRVEPGASPTADVTLSWPTFTAAADENGISRLYGGIHFRDADLEARRLGRLAGVNAWELATKYFNGTARPQQ